MSLRDRTIRLAYTRPELRGVLASALFPAAFDIGDPVRVRVNGSDLEGHVRSVSFTTGKVRYAVQLPDGGAPTTMWDLDSALVSPRPGPRVAFGYDPRS